jgi:hypothetical protein
MWPLWCAQPGGNEDTAASLFHRNFGLQEALEQLFGRKVDMVWASRLKISATQPTLPPPDVIEQKFVVNLETALKNLKCTASFV